MAVISCVREDVSEVVEGCKIDGGSGARWCRIIGVS